MAATSTSFAITNSSYRFDAIAPTALLGLMWVVVMGASPSGLVICNDLYYYSGDLLYYFGDLFIVIGRRLCCTVDVVWFGCVMWE